MIKINDRFECERDAYQWKLHQLVEVKKKGGAVELHPRTSYYASLRQVCNAVVDREAGMVGDMDTLKNLLVCAESMVYGRVKS